MRILHLASFTGNIGDNLNHSGLYRSLEKELGVKNFSIQEEEIREYFWKKKQFDQGIIKKFNFFDLIIVGGGNFFELWVENSRTGTSIDIPVDYLKKIKTPIAFFSLGVDIHQGYTTKTKENFFKFLDFISKKPKYFLSIRNDGALKNLRELYDDYFDKKVFVIPDSGIKIKETKLSFIKSKSNLIGINLAGDMIDKRYKNFHSTIEIITSFINYLIFDKEKNILFLPHILKDFEIIFQILNRLPEEIKRKNILIGPYENGYKGMKNIFGLYNNCEVILANRFHSNLASIGLEKPTIGLFNYPQIKNLYGELGLEKYLVNLNNKNLLVELKTIFNQISKDPNKHIKIIKNISKKTSEKYDFKIKEFCNWIKKNVK